MTATEKAYGTSLNAEACQAALPEDADRPARAQASELTDEALDEVSGGFFSFSTSKTEKNGFFTGGDGPTVCAIL